MRMRTGTLASLLTGNGQDELGEHFFNKFLNDILSPLRAQIVKDAGSREMIDVLMQLLAETDWDECYLEVEREEQEQWAYYEAQDKAEEEARLNELVTCHTCHTKLKLRETVADNENMWGAHFCNTCFASKHLTCCLCHTKFITANKLLNNFKICITCKRHEANRVNLQNARTRKLLLPSTLDFEAWMQTLQHFGHACAYCGKKYRAMEHYLPVESGGGTIASNCVPSCQRCNTTKNDKHPNEFERLFPTANIARIKAYFASLTV
jgi:5-methylcytosine-specific restriction endonuclease McrA